MNRRALLSFLSVAPVALPVAAASTLKTAAPLYEISGADYAVGYAAPIAPRKVVIDYVLSPEASDLLNRLEGANGARRLYSFVADQFDADLALLEEHDSSVIASKNKSLLNQP
jgi:hypothetical protein